MTLSVLAVGQTYPGADLTVADSTLMAEQLSKLRPDRDLQCYFRAAFGEWRR